MRTRLIIMIAVLATALCAMSQTWETVSEREVKPELERVAQDNNAFALNLYRQLAKGDGNLVFSPFSITSAFAMVYAGARGDTAKEMERVMHFSLGREKLHPALGELARDLNQQGRSGGYQLSLANRLWGREGYQFLAPYLDLLRTEYGAGLETVNFTDPAAAARNINHWIEEQTGGKIRDLVSPETLTPDTSLVLGNAIYFKGDWKYKFAEVNTKPEDFMVKPGTTIKAPLMYMEGFYNLGNGPGFQMLELDYQGGDLSMLVLLPDDDLGLPKLEKVLSPSVLKFAIGSLKSKKVKVWLPRFKLEHRIELGQELEKMGMRSLFIGYVADLSGMDGSTLLYISRAPSQAFVEVNEEGSEAADATFPQTISVGGATLGKGPAVFRADHSFIFLIRDNQTGAILFLGRVMDPRG